MNNMLTELYYVVGEVPFYDLSNGSLSNQPIGSALGVDIFSAEELLNRIDGSDTITIRKVILPTNTIKVKE